MFSVLCFGPSLEPDYKLLKKTCSSMAPKTAERFLGVLENFRPQGRVLLRFSHSQRARLEYFSRKKSCLVAVELMPFKTHVSLTSKTGVQVLGCSRNFANNISSIPFFHFFFASVLLKAYKEQQQAEVVNVASVLEEMKKNRMRLK